MTTAVAIRSINKKRLRLYLRIIHHQLLFTSAHILNLSSEGWAAGKAAVLIGIEGRRDWGLMKALLFFFPQILFFHVLEFLFSHFLRRIPCFSHGLEAAGGLCTYLHVSYRHSVV